MKPYSFHQRSGFTLIELLVVITIIAILATAILMDYGVATKKARLQVSAEEVMQLLEDAQVRSQTGYDVDIEEDELGNITGVQIYCWGVQLEVVPEEGVGEEPILTKIPLNDDDECAFEEMEDVEQLSWSKQVYVSALAIQIGENDPSDADDLQIVFVPPRGEIDVYESDVLQVNVSRVLIDVVHYHSNESQDDIYTKTIEVVPTTANFDIL